MLPYTPLHILLLADLGFPLVATSGNLSDEPICIDELEAQDRLGGIADQFLVHNRPIARHVDDSVARVLLDRELVLRRARGYAPLPIEISDKKDPVLAVGAHLKNSVALSLGGQVFTSQHIGDLETEAACSAFEQVIDSLERLYDARPSRVACDLHPDYWSTRYARTRGIPVVAVQHHLAHVLSCMAENRVEPPALGISWDGTGYGLDGTVWGGEFFHIERASFQRVASFRPFRLPGGDQAVREPRRSAAGLLFEIFGEKRIGRQGLPPLRAFSRREMRVLETMLARGVNAPLTSSVGRLFDAAASILGLRHRVAYEGQAAMELEYAADEFPDETEAYPLPLTDDAFPGSLDWEPMVVAILRDKTLGEPAGRIAARFHNTLVESIVNVARRISLDHVLLTGGCFQNARLTETAVRRLREEGFTPCWHQRVPPNDGGIALGQALAAQLNLHSVDASVCA
jgi:hydrogenase maturation protein HypF